MIISAPAVSPHRPLLLTGLIGAAVAALLGWLAPHGGAAWQIPGQVERQVSEALSVAGLGGLQVEMDGQQAVLHGIVEDEDDILRARTAALTAAGAGGAWAGGVTGVNVADVHVGNFDRPFTWSVSKSNGRITLNGAAPGENARNSISLAAHETFPNAQIVNGMHIAGGAPSPEFTEVAREAIRRLSGLNVGEARIVDSQIVFIGDGSQPGVNALRDAFAHPAPPFRSRIAVTVDGLDLEHPELQGLNLADASANTCDRAFARLMEHNVINFAPGSATIEPSSRGTLDALASVAERCDRFAIEVAGHTDNQGAREMNMQLSQRRADAVVNYLAAQGVARSQLTARGYGPDQPRSNNNTDAGQADNRRIEFSVSS